MLRIQITINQQPSEPDGAIKVESEIHCYRLVDDPPATKKEHWFADMLGDAMQAAIEKTGKEVGSAEITHRQYPR